MSHKLSEVCLPLSGDTQISGSFKMVGERVIGKDVNLKLVIKNPTSNSMTISAKIKAASIIYTKKEIHQLLNETRRIELKGNEEKEEPVTITYAQYEDLLTADNMIEVTAICSSEETNECVMIQTNIVLENPKFEIKHEHKAILNKPFTADVIFTNPFEKVVSNIVVIAEGSGLLKDPVTKRAGCLRPQETITIPITMIPYKTGKRHLLVDLTSNTFSNAKGYKEIQVNEKE